VLVYTGSDGPLYAFSLFLPSIISQVSTALRHRHRVLVSLMPPHPCCSQLGFKATPANLLTVPVYVFACIVTISAGFYADRKGRRGIQNMCGLCPLRVLSSRR
jgi:hypothetical protein